MPQGISSIFGPWPPSRPSNPSSYIDPWSCVFTHLHKSMQHYAIDSCPQEQFRAGSQPAPTASADQASASDSKPSSSSEIKFPEPNPQYRIWTDEELAAAKKSDPVPSPVADAFRAAMVLFFARFQSAVGRKVRVGTICHGTVSEKGKVVC